jgi:hypothetical protein
MSITTQGWGSGGIGTQGFGFPPSVFPGPGRPCIYLIDVVGDTARFGVIPPIDPDYAGTIIQYNEVGSCSGYRQAGPEDAGFVIKATGLIPGKIYVFTPWSYDDEDNIGRPGNPILATAPINIIDMPGLSLNSCSLELVWDLICKKINAKELSTVLLQADNQLACIASDSALAQNRLKKVEAEVGILKRRV